jgi:hypothetical protein
VTIFSEFGLLAVFSLSFGFECTSSEDKDIVMWSCISAILSIMAINYVDICVSQYYAIREIWHRWMSRRQRNKIAQGLEEKDEINSTKPAIVDV